MRRSARLASSLPKIMTEKPSPEANETVRESTASKEKRVHCSASPSANVPKENHAELTPKNKRRKRKHSTGQKTAKQDTILEPKECKLRPEVQENQAEVDCRKKYVGAHVSISGGLENAVTEALSIGAKAFALFLRSQRQWNSKPLDEDTAASFRSAFKKAGFSPKVILPHGIYLMNCGSPDEETLAKSRATLVDELQRCEKLGLLLYNFHPGSTCGKISVDDCLDRIAESINDAHKETNYVITVIENMSCQGNTVGGKFEELGGIINRVKDKSRVGVCLDTCHAFAAGYDLTTDEGFTQMMEEFDRAVGFKYLKAMHINDSKGELGCHLDRHENIGKGKIGLAGFRRVMREPRLNGIPMILETPCVSDATYEKEMKLLYSLLLRG